MALSSRLGMLALAGILALPQVAAAGSNPLAGESSKEMNEEYSDELSSVVLFQRIDSVIRGSTKGLGELGAYLRDKSGKYTIVETSGEIVKELTLIWYRIGTNSQSVYDYNGELANKDETKSLDEFIRKYRKIKKNANEGNDWRSALGEVEQVLDNINDIMGVEADLKLDLSSLSDESKHALALASWQYRRLEALRGRYFMGGEPTPGAPPGTPKTKADLAALEKLSASIKEANKQLRILSNNTARYMGRPPFSGELGKKQ
ncbi:MAG: hypothetical protein EOS20_34285 [Mesorhizobium sp.]|uniref:hypothetical protein n=1 Tax=Mesorhizobium sp. TaxID=1871066 RepID=UPI000FE78AAB|nr:hypothetical protein [Mesorhizobium sp.]RWQ28465.1 MAG: hypothetical protein EOS20_34285 [Mesorhizobium sp.]